MIARFVPSFNYVVLGCIHFAPQYRVNFINSVLLHFSELNLLLKVLTTFKDLSCLCYCKLLLFDLEYFWGSQLSESHLLK